MLLLTRRIDQTINIGPNIRVTVTRIRGYQVTLGIEAPRNVNIWREEIEQTQNATTSRSLIQWRRAASGPEDPASSAEPPDGNPPD